MNYITMDGSRLRLFIPYSASVWPDLRNWKMYYPDGTVIERAPANSSAWQTITDRNGNKIEFIDNKIQDSAGRYIEFASDSTGQIVRTKGINGAVVETHIEWEDRWIQKKYRTTTALNAQFSQQYATFAASVPGVKKITFPTQAGGQTMEFEYYSNATQPGANVYTDEWGEIKTITAPTGAKSSFNYSEPGMENYDGLASDVLARSVLNKALAYEEVYDGTTSQRVNPWLYSISKWASTITIPSGSVSSEYLFYNTNGSFWDSGMSYRSTGPNGGITERLWAYNLPFAMSGSIPPASGGWSGVGSANSYVKAEFSTLPDANGNISSTSPTAIKEFKFDKNGNVLEVLEYDWVAYGSVPRSGAGIYAKVTGLPTSGLTLKRKTVNTYYNQAADADSASVNGNEYMNPSSPSLKNLIRSTEVRDGSGVVKARSEFYYDSITTTGNLTETRVWDSTKGAVSDPLTTGTSGNAVSTQSTYDSYGNPTTVTDAKAIVSKIFYGEVLGPNGNVTGLYPTETIVADGTSLARTSTASYDFYTGAVLTTTDEDNDITNATEYDDLGRPTKAISALGKTLESWTITEYHDDDRFVVVKSDLEAKGDGKKVATQFYDQLGRVRLTKTLEDAATQSATNETDGVKVQTRYGINDPTPGVTTDPENSLGSYSLVSNPYRASSLAAASTETTMGWTLSYSSKTGRHSDTTTYSGTTVPTVGSTTNLTGTVTTDINANTTTVSDQAGKLRRSIINGLGQLERVDEPNASNQLDVSGSPYQPTSYTYDVLNNLLTVTQASSTTSQCGGASSCSQTRSFAYSSLSRLTSATNPESGTISYGYDPNGNLTSKIDARSITTTYAYDALNRVTTRSYNDTPQTPTVNYYYDQKTHAFGKLDKVSSSVSTTEYTSFDILGRVNASKQTTDGVIYGNGSTDCAMTYSYNLGGALLEQQYPSCRVVKNELDASGDLASVASKENSSAIFKTYANDFNYNAAGAVSSLKLGNGRFESTQFNSRLQPTQIGLGTSETTQNILELEYGYGTNANNGNVLSQTITVPTVGGNTGFSAVQTYTYDELNRLKSATENVTPHGGSQSQSWKQTYTFDRYGNRRFDFTGGNTTSPASSCTEAICNPTVSTTDNRLTSTGWQYDNAGNTIRDGEYRTFTYDGENKQTLVKNSSNATIGEYFYDGDGRRVKKIVPSTAEVTVFVYDAAGKLIGEYSTLVANSTDAKIAYLTSDHLGSPRITTDAIGQTTSRRDFMPFGEEILRSGYGSDSVRERFATYERDGETELDFAQARMYQNSLGRYLSIDPILMTKERPIDPQQISLYNYVRNNPYKFVDPTGEIYEFSSSDAESQFNQYKDYLEKCGSKCEDELKTLNRLLNSKVTYLINLKSGDDKSKTGEGELRTDGKKIIIDIDNVGGPSGEQYSLRSRFAHELEHGRQFDNGELAFSSDDGGKTWRPVAFDLSDEVKTHSAMLRVASASDFTNKDAGGRVVGRSRLGDFKNAKSDEERLDVIRASNYGVKRMNLADGPINFQPAKSISDGKKPGEIVQTTAWFGRIYKP
ncbi:MAG: RHS repeat protein [Chloracidobacterium sp.]|nr:RHS repeat protein [Chloracidobacterium sp.]